MIGSIEEDRQGCLWMGTNMGLVQLFVPMDENLATVRVYTTADGLQDNFFISQSSCSREGELFFGGNKGYNSFLPASLEKDNEAVPYLITDIKIFNVLLRYWNRRSENGFLLSCLRLRGS